MAKRRRKKRSVPCRICGKAVHGPEDGQGFKIGRLKFAACNECAPSVRNSAAAVGEVALKAIEGRYPRVALALSMAKAALMAPEAKDNHG